MSSQITKSAVSGSKIDRAAALDRGFTLIEIVLVLAIASFLMIIVFLALNGAQKNRRDYQRKQDLAQLAAGVETWRGNHLGDNLDTQTDLDDLGTTTLSNNRDPLSGQPYALTYFSGAISHTAVPAPPAGSISYVVEHICGTDAGPVHTYITDDPHASHGIRQFAALITLETGDVYCIDGR